ncbi:MAG: ribosome maturation factor RimP [Acidobacteria bacterium]|nr:ribosome maturation factor RimP [Acidobacteriota bacterium]NIM63082.1 ribosome maturation factor RimP [Acidobacteriota bacterium]NIO60793.1 ribosome maturation factor RimP [Acidobacteriota bacterium]NIQ31865.1 ribosome maturation factor RimP [Acidobacteriota bacterium]NIQ87242.1 ribosome maturation factor RimP [Acidobacteriota bacterium]
MGQSRHEILLEELGRLAGKVVADAGLELVELNLKGSSRKRVLRLDIDRPGPGGVGLEDCQLVSRQLGAALEEADLIQSAYVLEVSSPGIDRPIRTDDDIRRNAGRRVQIETTEPIEGRRVFAGVLVGGQADWVELRIDEAEVVKIPRDCIQLARQEASF